MLSVGIFRKTSFDWETSFLNKTSASCMIPTKSSHGVTRPPLVPADISCSTHLRTSCFAVTFTVLRFCGHCGLDIPLFL